LSGSEICDGRSPTARGFVCESERDDFGHPLQDGMNSFPHHARALAVDDPYLKDAFLPAFMKIFRQQILHFAGLKGVEIDNPVNREINWLILIV